jgi:cellulose synthase/poly-beta-1,6-N-acetylglucosamine synthase-like glycosyltransferase/putative flippase GtrA
VSTGTSVERRWIWTDERRLELPGTFPVTPGDWQIGTATTTNPRRITPAAHGARTARTPRPIVPVDVAPSRVRSSRYVRQLSFLAVGAVCFVLQLASLVGLLHLHLGSNLANATSFLIGAEVKFVLSCGLVWRDRFRAGETRRRFAWFNLTTAVIFFIDETVFASTDWILTAIPAAVLGVAVGTVASYLVCDRLVFRSGSRERLNDGIDRAASAVTAPAPWPSWSVSPRRAELSPNGDCAHGNNGETWTAANAHRCARLWLIVPAYNEEARLGGTLEQYRLALAPQDRLVIVVNGSTDGTEQVARQAAAEDPRLIVTVDERKIGKGGALLAGYRFVSAHAEAGDVVGYTDADAAVAGDEIVRFCGNVSAGELLVGSRWQDTSSQLRRQPVMRQFASRVFNQCVRKTLSLNVKDTQCAAKALRADRLRDVIGRVDSSGFAFDVDLILSARAAGLTITEAPVRWADQEGSTVSMRRAAPAMMREVIRLRRKYRSLAKAAPVASELRKRVTFMPDGADGLLGRPDDAHGSSFPPTTDVEVRLPPADRQRVLSGRQKVAFITLAATITASLFEARGVALVVLSAAVTIFFAAANLVKLDLIRRGTSDRRNQVRDSRPGARLADEQLPIYTILLPVYREDSILKQLIDGILALDYPREKLDVKLLLEEDDVMTRDAVARIALPPCFEVIIVPDVGPTGKPRACNAGLTRAKGEYLVIYDAEDRPERDQLRKAVDAFTNAPQSVVCMQAKLNYFNRTHNLLTRWFTAEYSLWFDQLLPGLQAMDVAIPLGGTSNHFLTTKLRKLGGWDAYNVTEDADLGIRIYLSGWKTAILDSTTYEEATSRCHNWVRQRSRWVKGYMQTYLRHMCSPIKLYRQMGAKPFAMLQLFFGAGTVCLLLNPFYWLMTVVWFADHYHLIQILFPRPLLYAGIVGLFLGNASFTLAAVSGAYGRRNYDDVKWALITPLYWVLMSVAAWKALIQLCHKPFYWEKTVHGYCMYEPEMSLAGGDGDVRG